MDFLYPLRILAGRQLTRREIVRAQKGEEMGYGLSRTIYGTSDSGFTVSHETFRPVFNIGGFLFEIASSDSRTYTQDGKLRQRVINNYRVDTITETTKTQYGSPGRFIGKTQKEKKAA